MKTKRKLIVALACINVALVVWMLSVSSAPPAQAQVIGVGTDYLVAPGRIATDRAAVYVVDLARHALAAWHIDTTSKDFELIGVRDLKADFRERPRRDER